ncbi:MAG: hypothetical protein CMF22_11595 [Idiomarinaceae bacterium]|nr:hypothetical protein [Idiomarinaceae bacterium]|tara:strand:- start:73750 stop:74166 length:417 start_codon:yes stop_codon:yes gene_type:complete
MSKTKQGQSQSAQYATYKNSGRYAKNRIAKLERHLKKHPEDGAAAKALANAKGSSPRRKTPNNKVWSSTARQKAQLYKMAGLNGNIGLGGKMEADHKDSLIGYGLEIATHRDTSYGKEQKAEKAKKAKAAAKGSKKTK